MARSCISMSEKLTCAKRPCGSCPYRKDAPSGLWDSSEYEKLPDYDGEIIDQVMQGAIGVFMCHQQDGKLCAGWVAAHGPQNLVALRMASGFDGNIDEAVWTYKTDVPVFASGVEARNHGMQDIEEPGSRARMMMTKLSRKK